MRIFILSIIAMMLFPQGSMLSDLQAGETGIESADNLFKAGKFAEAEKLYSKVLAKDRANYQAAVRMGNIALLTNRLDEARKWLTKAIALKPEEKLPKSLLAEAYYRRDEFEKAALLLRSIGKEVIARKLESFKGLIPYKTEGRVDLSHVKFIQTDLLPLIEVRVNDGKPVNFLIDTGASEIYLDTEFAKEVNAAQFGAETSTFAGNQQATLEHGRIDSLTLGDFVIKNLPVHILSTRRFSAVAQGKRVDGIIGTVLLYHFISTLDYRRGELILQRKSRARANELKRQLTSEKQTVIPFWMSGDHFIVAWGKIGKSEPVLLFVDTGLAGMGFTGPQSIIDEAGIKVSTGQIIEGTGGGGKVRAVPFIVDELSLGEARAQGITGLLGPFPTSLEYGQGFRIAGLISHQFFRPYAVTFDFTNMRLLLGKVAQAVSPNPRVRIQVASLANCLSA